MLADTDPDGLKLNETECDGLSDELGERLEDGLKLDDGLILPLFEALGLVLADGLVEAEGLVLADIDPEGEMLGEIE